MFSTHDKIDEFVASCNGCLPVIKHNSGSLKVGAGECLPEWPEGGLPGATTSHRDDLQAESGSLPVENVLGIKVGTHKKNMAQINKEMKGQNRVDTEKSENKKIQVLGYVPI